MRIQRLPDGGVKLWLSANDTYNWATRPGNSWPCSTLKDKRIFAEFASNGDLVDWAINGRQSDNYSTHEFNCITSDFLK